MRSALAVAAVAAALGSVLLAFAYTGIRSSLLDERQASARRQADLNARSLRSGLRADSADPAQLLSQLRVAPEGQAVLIVDDQVFATTAGLDVAALPEPLVAAVLDDEAGQQRAEVSSSLALVTGVPIAEAGAHYFEVTSLEPVSSALDSVAAPLVVASVAATAIGGLVGLAISGAVLRPVTTTSALALRIAGGDSDARLDVGGDPDLAGLADSFNEMVGQLHGRIDREAAFASNVSHELRGPLMALEHAIERVDRQRDVLPVEAADAIDALEHQVRSFNRLVLDLLEISRFDAGTAELVVREVDVGELVRAVFDERGDEVPVVEPGGPVLAVLDPRRLHQVLTNLLDNAASYASGATAVVVEPLGDQVRITVEDDGPGIGPEERDRIFERFERGTAGRALGASSGTGLGLALVAHHVALHGGSVTVASGPGGGARLVVELPRRAA